MNLSLFARFLMATAGWQDYGILPFFPDGNRCLNTFRLRARLKNSRKNITMRLPDAKWMVRLQSLSSLCCRRSIIFWMIFLFRYTRITNIFRNTSGSCLMLWNTMFLTQAKCLWKNWGLNQRRASAGITCALQST